MMSIIVILLLLFLLYAAFSNNADNITPFVGSSPDVNFVKLKCPKCGYETEVREYDPDYLPRCPKDNSVMIIK